MGKQLYLNVKEIPSNPSAGKPKRNVLCFATGLQTRADDMRKLIAVAREKATQDDKVPRSSVCKNAALTLTAHWDATQMFKTKWISHQMPKDDQRGVYPSDRMKFFGYRTRRQWPEDGEIIAYWKDTKDVSMQDVLDGMMSRFDLKQIILDPDMRRMGYSFRKGYHVLILDDRSKNCQFCKCDN